MGLLLKRIVFFGACAALLGCASEAAGPSPKGDAGVDEPSGFDVDSGFVVPARAKAVLDIYAADIWGQPLPEENAKLVVQDGSTELQGQGFPKASFGLTDLHELDVHLEAQYHEPLDIVVDVRNPMEPRIYARAEHEENFRYEGAAIGVTERYMGGRKVPVVSLFLGLRHMYFSSEGRPARRGNDVQFLMDGEQAWGTVRDDLLSATKSVHLSTWWWQSKFELVRDLSTHMDASEDERFPNTMMGILQSTDATKRILVWQSLRQDGFSELLNTDPLIRARAEDDTDNFEVMTQANETNGAFLFAIPPFSFNDRINEWVPSGVHLTEDRLINSTVPDHQVDLTEWLIPAAIPIASYHQKFIVIDDETAFVGGMNVKAEDWDSSQHLVYDPRRMDFDSSSEKRHEVFNHERDSDSGPRKDYMLRIHGPAVQDVQDVFAERWQYLLDTKVQFSENATAFEPRTDFAAGHGGLQIQLTTTMPEPFWEHATAESWINAVRHAEKYIYIEDQYFRIPLLVDEIIARMTDRPDLRLVVVTKPVSEWTDPGCYWTAVPVQQLRERFPDRFMLLQMRSFDTYQGHGFDETQANFRNIDVHAKIMIVDDVFMSVGSTNKNNRGIIYEGEMNVAIVDRDFVTAARRRMFTNILPDTMPPAEDVSDWWYQFQDAAAANDAVYDAWADEHNDLNLDGAALPPEYVPEGFLYSLEIAEPDDCLIETVGPDQI